VATRGRTFKRPWRRSCHSSKLKSSSAPIGRKDSWRFHAVGSEEERTFLVCEYHGLFWRQLKSSAARVITQVARGRVLCEPFAGSTAINSRRPMVTGMWPSRARAPSERNNITPQRSLCPRTAGCRCDAGPQCRRVGVIRSRAATTLLAAARRINLRACGPRGTCGRQGGRLGLAGELWSFHRLRQPRRRGRTAARNAHAGAPC
jgi:hypothetical protein